MTAAGVDVACYVYGVVSADEAARAAARATSSVDPSRSPRVVVEGELAALVSDVSAAEFGEEALPGRLEDPLWLEAKVRAHEDVLERALDATPVVPFRLCTLYRREDDVRRFLSAHARELADVLERVRGRVELGVKAFADRELLEQNLADGLRLPEAGEPGKRPTGGSGRDYMLRRRLERALADAVERFCAECAHESHARLSASAEDARLVDLQPAELSGRSGDMLLNAAYLVRRGDPSFDAALAELTDRYRAFGVSFEPTGPWPPYNFVPRELGEV